MHRLRYSIVAPQPIRVEDRRQAVLVNVIPVGLVSFVGGNQVQQAIIAGRVHFVIEPGQQFGLRQVGSRHVGDIGGAADR